MAHDYEKSKKIALSTILLLGVITIVEVGVALLGKGYIVEGWHWPIWLMGILMIVLSLTKAVYIVFEFMHMKYEMNGLAKSVLLPTFLLVWGVIAFLYEGNDWGNRRDLIDNKNKEKIEEIGYLKYDAPDELLKDYTI
ncbi:MAG: cytochrome C oxidase subunit IV family protein [Saprospiraceae bacterium]|nr:cytochrome C oxidase subunit IV family protein [Saprospiraceae bacterium]|tara:strand:+ start:4422 stop:4835 length:414 start_codon:yes stop_codon:yes gene_type:complete